MLYLLSDKIFIRLVVKFNDKIFSFWISLFWSIVLHTNRKYCLFNKSNAYCLEADILSAFCFGDLNQTSEWNIKPHEVRNIKIKPSLNTPSSRINNSNQRQVAIKDHFDTPSTFQQSERNIIGMWVILIVEESHELAT